MQTGVFLGLSLSHSQPTWFSRKQVTSGKPLFSGFELEVLELPLVSERDIFWNLLSLRPHSYQLPADPSEELKCFIYVYSVLLYKLKHRSSQMHVDTHAPYAINKHTHTHSVIHTIIRPPPPLPLPPPPLPQKSRQSETKPNPLWMQVTIKPYKSTDNPGPEWLQLLVFRSASASSPSSTCNVHEESPQLCGSFMWMFCVVVLCVLCVAVSICFF